MTQSEAIQIGRTLIEKFFPELSHQRIRYRFVTGKRYDFYMAVRWFVWEYRIYIEKEILQFSTEAFTGCIAHELAHIVFNVKRNYFLDMGKFLTASKSEREEERNADLLVIERGLGNALLKFHQEHGRVYKAYNDTEGLTRQEIKQLMNRQK